ncbi:N-terminal acetyltransferase [Arachnomyces sp. PD_36]|nr:N-terminal acetyltransferase [Arachnomyces sp. PD_36]
MSSAYTPSQLTTYLSHISFPSSPSLPLPQTLQTLSTLHTHQISTIPYENLSLHYSPTHQIRLDPQLLFEKFVGKDGGNGKPGGNGRGGYCMENSIFFNHVLRGLGFRAYLAGARIRLRGSDGVPGGEFTGWRHIVNIITLPDGSKYMSDVGFGGDGATKPLPLLPDGQATHNSIGTQEIRLIHDFIPGQTERDDESRKLWIYQYRNGEGMDWNSFYCFPEVEFLEADFEVVNYYTGTHPVESFQVRTVLVVKFLMDRGEEGGRDGEGGTGTGIYGKVMMVNGDVKMNLGGKTSVVKRCRTEEERIEALREYFGIVLTEEEREGIRGWTTELRG